MLRWAPIVVGWLLAFASVRFAGDEYASIPVSPHHASRDLAIVLAFAAIAFALFGSRTNGNAVVRVLAGLAVVPAAIAEWVAFDNCLQNSFHYPWTWVVATGSLLCVGGWFCRQRVLALVSACFVVVWFYAAFTPATTRLPATAVSGEYTATLYSDGNPRSPWWRYPGPSWRVRIAGPRAHDPSQLVDSEHA